MAEIDEVVNRLRTDQVLAGIRWAYLSAVSRTLDDYSEDAGYDAVGLGCTRHTLFRDRLDRVFACGRYKIDAGKDPSDGLDLLYAELTARDAEAMPKRCQGYRQCSWCGTTSTKALGGQSATCDSCSRHRPTVRLLACHGRKKA